MANCIELQIGKGRFYLFVLAFFLASQVCFFFVSRCKSVFISIPQFNISHCFFNATCRYIIKFFVELTTIHIHFAEFFWKAISSREITTVSMRKVFPPGVLSIWGGNCSANNRICTFSAWFQPLCLVQCLFLDILNVCVLVTVIMIVVIVMLLCVANIFAISV